MGESLGWIATRGRNPEIVRAALGLAVAEELEINPSEHGVEEDEWLDRGLDEGACAFETKDGWYIVVSRKLLAPLYDEAVAARLSGGDAEVVTCFYDEHVMASAASEWRAGQRAWHIAHDSVRGTAHLNSVGTLPASFAQILPATMDAASNAARMDASLDLAIEAPLNAAEHRTGFRYDRYDSMALAAGKQVELLVARDVEVQRRAVDVLGMGLAAVFLVAIAAALLLAIRGVAMSALAAGSAASLITAVLALTVLGLGVVASCCAMVTTVRRAWTGDGTIRFSHDRLNLALALLLAANCWWLASRVWDSLGLAMLLVGLGIGFSLLSGLIARAMLTRPDNMRAGDASEVVVQGE